MSKRCTAGYAGLAVLAALGWMAIWMVAGGSGAAAEESTAPPIATPSDETPKTDAPPKSDSPERDRAVTEFERRLGKFKPLGKDKRKAPEDIYLVGTAVINPEKQHADVRFQVVQGQRKTAEFLVDFITGQAQGTLNKWHVFARFKENADAEQALASARQQYDQMVAYRQEMQRIYQVLSTTRC